MGHDEEKKEVEPIINSEYLKGSIILQNENSIYCKLCGEPFLNINSVKKCRHCELPICLNCRSNNFCLNCWINFDENARRITTFIKNIVKIIPLLTIFTIFLGFSIYLLINLILILLMHFIKYSIFVIADYFPEKFFSKNWQEFIESKEYSDYFDIKTSKRLIFEENRKNFNYKKAKQIEDLKLWISDEIDVSDKTISLNNYKYLQDIKNKSTDLNKIESIGNEPFRSNDNKAYLYNYNGKPCPICKSIINFGNFCPECSQKFCIECGAENHFSSTKCLCGEIFPSLEIEFEQWIQKKKN